MELPWWLGAFLPVVAVSGVWRRKFDPRVNLKVQAPSGSL